MISFEIPSLPKRPNQSIGRGWRANHGERLKWRRWVGLALLGKRPVEPYKRSKIKIIRCSSKEPDYDGLVASCKILIDCLKHHKVIEDDSMKHIKTEYLHQKVMPKMGKVIVSVYPVDEL